MSLQGLPWCAALGGALLAAWMVLQAHGTINNDGLLYIEAARLFSIGQWQAGLKLYNWPLYSLLIAGVHRISGLGLQACAHLLAVFAFALMSRGLVVLVREVGGDRRAMWAAMLLLFASPYLVGDILPMVVRDHLFWAAHVWSLVYFLRFCREPAMRHAWGWGGAAMLAVLLRIEALTHLLLLPAVVLADGTLSWPERWRRLLRAHALLLVAGATLLAAYAVIPALHVEHLGRLQDPLHVLLGAWNQLTHGLAEKAGTYGEQVLGPFLDDYARSGLLLTLGYVLLVKVLGAAGWPQLGVALWGRLQERGPGQPYDRVFVWLVVLGLVNGLCILLANFLLPKRYLLTIGFVILVYAAFGMQAIWARWLAHRRGGWKERLVFPALLGALTLQFLWVVWPSDPQKMPALQAAHWLKRHVPPDSRVYYDARRIRYYVSGDASDRTEDPWPVVQVYFDTREIYWYDYAVVRVHRKFPEREKYLTAHVGAPPVASFADGHGNQVLIYRTRR
jgi:hypothetical protein